MLGRIRMALGRGPLNDVQRAVLEARIAEHPRSLIPGRAVALDAAARAALFAAMAEEVDATVAEIAAMRDVPQAVARYLAERNLPAQLVLTPDPRLRDLPWRETALTIRTGVAEDRDPVGVSAAFAAIAETGTLMLASAPETPARNNFLPDTHVVVLERRDVVGIYEEAWDRLRAAGPMPRTVNFITGPSRTGDIAQKLELGAHGPRRLHILLVGDGSDGRA
jgi:L-lactate dehydrogenase complex protein LldG